MRYLASQKLPANVLALLVDAAAFPGPCSQVCYEQHSGSTPYTSFVTAQVAYHAVVRNRISQCPL